MKPAYSVLFAIFFLIIGSALFPSDNSAENTIMNTRIISHSNGDNVTGIVTVIAEVVSCNCSEPTSLLIDGFFIENGTFVDMVSRNGTWFEIYTHQWDSNTVLNGDHVIEIRGKHKEYFDAVLLCVHNKKTISIYFDEDGEWLQLPRNNSTRLTIKITGKVVLDHDGMMK